MNILLIVIGSVLAIAGYVWLFVLVVREIEASAILVILLIAGSFSLISVIFVWYFAVKRWDISQIPFLIHLLGLFLVAIGIAVMPSPSLNF